MGNWAVLDSNNSVVNIIIADTEEIATACSWGAKVVNVTDNDAVVIGFTYLENNEWQDNRVRDTAPPIPTPIEE